jgi:N-acetylated-alpha-linked acidic dipeptidase
MAINQKLKQLEKVFLHEKGMPFGDWYKSLYVASDPYTGYSSWLLPALKYCVYHANFTELKKWDKITAEALERMTNKIKEINKEF